jgi:hypothetical protein
MMSSKIVEIYYLTEYRFGRTMLIWPKLRFKATDVNAVSTLGFPAKGMMRNPKFAQSVNRLIGTLRASQMEKRQSGRNRKRPEVLPLRAAFQKRNYCVRTMRGLLSQVTHSHSPLTKWGYALDAVSVAIQITACFCAGVFAENMFKVCPWFQVGDSAAGNSAFPAPENSIFNCVEVTG